MDSILPCSFIPGPTKINLLYTVINEASDNLPYKLSITSGLNIIIGYDKSEIDTLDCQSEDVILVVI